MKDNTYSAYNTVFNGLLKNADQFYSIGLNFKTAELIGFYKFAMNESKERWNYGNEISHYIIESWKKPVMSGNPKPIESFPDPSSAIKAMEDADKSILNAIESAINSASNEDTVEVYKMSEMFNYLRMQYNEIAHIRKKLSQPGMNIHNIDSYLMEMFEDMKNPCGKRY